MTRTIFQISAVLKLTSATVAVAGGVALADDVASRRTDGALDRALEKLVAMPGGPPGVIAIVQRGKERRIHLAGVADLSNDRPIRFTDHMRIASVAKAFSGAAALSLVSKGDLSLDDTIGERLPDLPDSWSEVSLRQLLNHTSGLPDFSKSRRFAKAVLASPERALPPRELLAFVANKPPIFTSGSRYKYSNSDNIVVGLMVEAATNDRYTRALKNQVFGPLGLARTSLPAGPELPAPFITATTTTHQ